MTKIIDVYQLPEDRPPPFLESADDESLAAVTQHLQACLNQLLASNPQLAEYILQMKMLNLQVVVFGGWPRDRIIELTYKRKTPSRDIDFVVYGPISVEKALPPAAVRNPFGGFGFEMSDLHVDIWDLANTFLIKKNNLPASINHLPLTADYNINAIAFKPDQFFEQAELIDAGAIHAVRNGAIDFAANEVAQPLIQAARSVILATKLELTISNTIKNFIRSTCASEENLEKVVIGIKNYCPQDSKDDALSLLFSTIESAKNK